MPISLEGRHLLAFCGASRVGKSTVARKVAQMLGSPYVSFGDHVRSVAARLRVGTANRRELQDLGQELVDSDARGFCLEIFSQVTIPGDAPIVVDGLRHARIISELRALLPGFRIHIVFLEADDETRMSRGETVSKSELQRIDSHEVEKDLDLLRSQADIVVNANNDLSRILSVIEVWLGRLGASDETLEEKRGESTQERNDVPIFDGSRAWRR